MGEILLSIPFFYLLQAYAFAEQLHFASVATSMMNLKLLLTIEIIILVTAFVSHPYLNPQVQTLWRKLCTVITLYIPGLYVLLYKQAGWKRLIGLVQFLLFLFILPGLTIDISLVWLPFSILLLLVWWSRRLQKNIAKLATISSRA
jgi:ABC-type sulfate transport system permease subunit